MTTWRAFSDTSWRGARHDIPLPDHAADGGDAWALAGFPRGRRAARPHRLLHPRERLRSARKRPLHPVRPGRPGPLRPGDRPGVLDLITRRPGPGRNAGLRVAPAGGAVEGSPRRARRHPDWDAAAPALASGPSIALFTGFGLRVRHALLVGLAYVVIWEAAVATISVGKGPAAISIRHYAESILSHLSHQALSVFGSAIDQADLWPSVSVLVAVMLVGVVATSILLSRQDVA